MNQVKLVPKVNFTVVVELNEGDLKALDALVGYGFEAFINTFYTHLGSSYLKPYEGELKNLFEKIQTLRPAIAEINEAKKKLGITVLR